MLELRLKEVDGYFLRHDRGLVPLNGKPKSELRPKGWAGVCQQKGRERKTEGAASSGSERACGTIKTVKGQLLA